MNNKIWVVTYCDMSYNEKEPTVTCFNNKEHAVKYYEYLLGKYCERIIGGHDVVSIDECEVYTEFEVYE